MSTHVHEGLVHRSNELTQVSAPPALAARLRGWAASRHAFGAEALLILCVASCFWRSDVRGGTGPYRVIVGAELTHPGESA
jgi:hypothetical protein